jgi:flagellar hook-associated protein 1 FlgK
MFETVKSGLNVAMQNINVTSHNISNANTKGYTRQRLVTSAKETSSETYLIRPLNVTTIGQGVEVLDTQQIRSDYLDSQYRDLNTGYGYNEYRSQALKYIETLFNAELEEGKGLTGAIENFYSSLNTFTSDTTSQENRVAVQQTAEGLTESFNLIYNEMEALWVDQNDSITLAAENINSIAKKLAGLNDTISVYEVGGYTANDLRDERNLLIDELSKYINFDYSVNEDDPSMIDISIGGAELVSGRVAGEIEIGCAADSINSLTSQIAAINADIESAGSATSGQLTDLLDLTAKLGAFIEVDTVTNASGGYDISYKGISLVTGAQSSKIEDAVSAYPAEWARLSVNTLTLNGSELSIESGLVKSGEVYAHMEMALSNSCGEPGLPYYMEQLNTLARDIAKDINDIHLKGYSYDTNDSTAVTTSKTGIYFFNVDKETDSSGAVTAEYYDRITAGNFSVSSEITGSVWNIAASSGQVNSDGETLNSGNSETAQLLYNTLADNKYYDSLNSIVGHLAISLDTSQNMLDAKQTLINSIDTQRTSISGVSLDEEATNLIIYQQTYKACSRVMNTIDEMLDTLLSMF